MRGGGVKGGGTGSTDPHTISVPNPPIQSFFKSNFNPHLKGSNGGWKMIKKSLSIRLVTSRYSHYVNVRALFNYR